jgi:hypothetical protein
MARQAVIAHIILQTLNAIIFEIEYVNRIEKACTVVISRQRWLQTVGSFRSVR